MKARTFFLNEQHELERGERDQGGGTPKYAHIDWAAKGQRIHRSLQFVKTKIKRSKDPTIDQHYFLLVNPEVGLRKVSKSAAKPPEYDEPVDYSREDSFVFQRLGLDLLQVNEDRTAAVHAAPSQFERMLATADALDRFSQRDKYRWAKVGKFDLISPKYRVDEAWLNSLKSTEGVDTIVELQPLLLDREVATVINAIVGLLRANDAGEIKGGGKDFSGRQWFRGKMTRRSIEDIAREFYSVQALHSPLVSVAAGKKIEAGRIVNLSTPEGRTPDIRSLPCVAVLDTGIPEDHIELARYAAGRYQDPGAVGVRNDHGCFVASRVVFGDRTYGELASRPVGECSYYDASIAHDSRGHIDDKGVIEAMTAIVRTRPDVRVFNLSFDGVQALPGMSIAQKEKLRSVQELDNLIFANDVIVAVAAGNSDPGVQPSTPYPNHYTDARWHLAHWARSFNAITCGSFVAPGSIGEGLVRQVGWPSPFSRLGPGFCESPKPDFSAHGGNLDSAYRARTGLGVFGLSERGMVEDRSGTSHAVPLLSREAAFTATLLDQYCAAGGRPYGVTVKAFLALTAAKPVNDPRVRKLAKVALGRGTATSDQLRRPLPTSAVFIWQGVLESNRDRARVRIPVPSEWLRQAKKPVFRLVLAWDTPVNCEVNALWACRKVDAQFRLGPDEESLYPKGHAHRSYPLIERRYMLKSPRNVAISGDEWLLELSYREIAAYPAMIDVSPQQRVAFAGELFDESEDPVSPQAAVQSLPIAAGMIRLSTPPTVVRNPVIVKTRL